MLKPVYFIKDRDISNSNLSFDQVATGEDLSLEEGSDRLIMNISSNSKTQKSLTQ